MSINWTKHNRAVNTWMYLHRDEARIPNSVPIGVVKYCSQSFVDFDEFGYDIATRGGDKVSTIKITTSDILAPMLDANNQPIADDVMVPAMLRVYSSYNFLVAELVNGEILNMAVHWDTDDTTLRRVLSDALTVYVNSITGYLRPEYCNDDGWDMFESE
jgi:hypothetical protein